MNEYIVLLLLFLFGFGLGYGFCWYLYDEKMLQAYEDGVIDGKGLREIQEISHPRESWQ